jgi:hypothetical protein
MIKFTISYESKFFGRIDDLTYSMSSHSIIYKFMPSEKISRMLSILVLIRKPQGVVAGDHNL